MPFTGARRETTSRGTESPRVVAVDPTSRGFGYPVQEDPNILVDEIRALARERGILVRALAPSTVKKRVCGDGRATKREVARAVVVRYPELKVYLGQDRKWKERYHGNMFDAVAIGMASGERALASHETPVRHIVRAIR